MEDIVLYLYNNKKLNITNNGDNYRIKFNKHQIIGDNYFGNTLSTIVYREILSVYSSKEKYVCCIGNTLDTYITTILSFKFNIPLFILNKEYNHREK